ncbi:hypothetical protein AB7Y49_02455 [Providencia vermicola]|uniref:Uncharacterized protein n=1 Tax=Providencia vermicola TaxID=333965 RepID=A0AAX3RWJ9_9GAMM|nr:MULTISPECIES: hypothetical protein [Providencia]ELX8377553.1 hypothetical protein [Providencia stuartii]EMD5257094.1 hypothetical protein [Providencia stuartii]USB37082.1 hypothetical protein M5J11_00755 [Providencia vermicola]WFC06014.1 hypothetical protein PG365_15100 [Providencia vermicola]
MFTDIEAAIEECRFRSATEIPKGKKKRYLCVVQLRSGAMKVIECQDAIRQGLSVMYSIGKDRYHTVLPEVR